MQSVKGRRKGGNRECLRLYYLPTAICLCTILLYIIYASLADVILSIIMYLTYARHTAFYLNRVYYIMI